MSDAFLWKQWVRRRLFVLCVFRNVVSKIFDFLSTWNSNFHIPCSSKDVNFGGARTCPHLSGVILSIRNFFLLCVFEFSYSYILSLDSEVGKAGIISI